MASQTYLFRITHWLLTAGTILALLFTLLMILAEGGLVVALLNADHWGIPAVLKGPDIPAEVTGITRDTIFAVAMPVVGFLAVGALVFALIFHLTAKIMETAILGDPFVDKNADRLNWIAGLLLAIEVVDLAFGTVMQLAFPTLPHLGHGHPNIGDINFDLGPQLSFVGLLAVLLIFVLAQVFRRGSEMRAELEGTV